MGNYSWVNHSFVKVIFSNSKHFIVVKIALYSLIYHYTLRLAHFLATNNIAAMNVSLFSYVTNANIYIICQFNSMITNDYFKIFHSSWCRLFRSLLILR